MSADSRIFSDNTIDRRIAGRRISCARRRRPSAFAITSARRRTSEILMRRQSAGATVTERKEIYGPTRWQESGDSRRRWI